MRYNPLTNRGITEMLVGPHDRVANTSRRKAPLPGSELQFDPEDEIGCFVCGHFRSYNFEHDSNYCDPCNSWLEGVCKDPRCPFCPKRPKYPKYTD